MHDYGFGLYLEKLFGEYEQGEFSSLETPDISGLATLGAQNPLGAYTVQPVEFDNCWTNEFCLNPVLHDNKYIMQFLQNETWLLSAPNNEDALLSSTMLASLGELGFCAIGIPSAGKPSFISSIHGGVGKICSLL